jgi:hypothetical protein
LAIQEQSVLFFSRDPGGTNQVIAAYRRLAARIAGRQGELPAALAALLAEASAEGTPRLAVFAKDYARERWAEAGIAARDWAKEGIGGLPGGARVEAAAAVLRRERALALITATADVDDRTEQLLWRAAAALGIPSYALLDHTVNLVQRFTDGDGRRVVPSRILAIDEASHEALVGAGIPPERVEIVGDLHLVALREQGAAASGRAKALRRAWGAGPDDTVVLFASENATEMAEAGRPAPYDEFACLERLIDVLTHGSWLGPGPFLVVVRPHPKDRPGKYAEYEGFGRGGVRLVVSAEGRAIEAAQAADGVVGMNSTLLYEAAELGRPVHTLVDDGAVRLPRVPMPSPAEAIR